MSQVHAIFQSRIRLLSFAFGSYWPHLLLIAVLGFFSSLLEGLGITTIIPIFSFVSGGSGQTADTITRTIAHAFAVVGVPYTFRFLIIFVGALFVTRVVALFAIQNITARIVFGYARDMRNKMFSLTLKANWPFLSKQKVGHLDQLLLTNTTNASQFFGFFSTAVLITTKTLAYTVIAINISPVIAWLSLIAGVILSFLLKPLFYKNKALSARSEELNRTLAHFVSQHISGMKVVKSLAAEAPVTQTGHDYFENIRSVYVSMTTLRGLLEMGVQFVGLAFVAGVFVYMYKFANFNFATFAIIVYAVQQIFTQVQAAQVQFHAFSTMFPYLTSALSHIHEAQTNAEVAEEGGSDAHVSEQIEFRNVSFSYPQRQTTLSNVSFTIKRGEMVGVVGPSGAGKSTIADIMLRLIEPTSGVVFVDGMDIREIPLSAWRKNIGYVPQDAFLLNDTIRNNIAFYEPSMTEEKMVRFAKLAHIHDFIQTLPDGYDTFIGDRGHFFSGGQRQRLVLARMLAREPQILVLDEATSALDHESKRAIQETIMELHGAITVVVISHNDEIIDSADQVVVIEDGKVLEVKASDRTSKHIARDSDTRDGGKLPDIA